MILRFGASDYLDQDEVEISQIGDRAIIGPFGRWHGTRRYWAINGVVRAAGTTNLKVKMDARFSDSGGGLFNQQDYNRAIGLYISSGGTLVHEMSPTNSRNGVKVKDFKWHNAPFGPHAQGLNYRSYYALIEADYPSAAQSGIYMWKETIEQIGSGGRDFRIQESIAGTPIDQTVKTYTGFMVRQYGSAIGLLSHPTPPSPIAPGSLVPKSSSVARSTPEWPGLVTDMLYPVRWNYLMAGTTILYSTPPVFP